MAKRTRPSSPAYVVTLSGFSSRDLSFAHEEPIYRRIHDRRIHLSLSFNRST